MGTRRDTPPTDWPGMEMVGFTKVTDDIYFEWMAKETNPTSWHWCAAHACWVDAGTSGHTLVSREPLHLEPSLLWNCCGLHGFVRGGQWTNA